jgi:hypothetical protein
MTPTDPFVIVGASLAGAAPLLQQVSSCMASPIRARRASSSVLVALTCSVTRRASPESFHSVPV